ncbi:hypothetical protein [Arthrobacter woluwensis]|uniref:hypothetical protein n=1 Tax=Arthrobacter woluwensis TaxID=156980 RepID=UPI001AAEDD07|nr:hypothetical protein [Arthrobacter woluwensis]QTF71258.1 hypothetical protein G8758_03980 [Arthrobacter woluwensis]
MNKGDTARLLSKAALVDNRIISPETVEAWHEIVGHLDYRLALEALRIHRTTATDYLMPAHIIANTCKAREELELADRKQRAIEPPKELDPDDYRIPARIRVGLSKLFERSDVTKPKPVAEHELERRRQMAEIRERNAKRNRNIDPTSD